MYSAEFGESKDLNMIKKLNGILRKYKEAPIQVKAAGWYTVCNILQKGIQFIFIPIYVRLLTTEEYGKYSVFQSWKEILVIFTTLNLYSGVFTKAMVSHEDDRDRYTSTMQGLTTVIAAFWLLIYAAFSGFFNNIFSIDSVTMYLIFIYSALFPAQSFWSVRQRVENKYISLVVVTLLMSVLTPGISIILLITTDLREKSVIWGFLFVQIVFGALFYFYHFSKAKSFYYGPYWKDAICFNIPLIPHYLSLIVLGQADRIMIERFCGNSEAGIYSLAYQISQLLNILVNAVNSVFVPWGYEQLKAKQLRKLNDSSKSLCLLYAAATLCIILVAPEIILIAGGKEYAQAMWIIPSVSISSYVVFCYGFYGLIEFYYSKTKYVMVASSVSAILNVILNAVFIPIFGFIAAGYTTLASYIALMFMHFIFARKISKSKINTPTVFSDVIIMTSIVGLIVIGGLSMLIYNLPIVRYAIIAAIVIILILNRNRLINLFNIISKSILVKENVDD